MILSNVEIQRAIDENRLLIEPEPMPRQPTGAVGVDCPYQTTSVDLRLGDQISYFKEGLPRGGFARLFGPMSESQVISSGQPFVLRPNRLVLGRTLEKVTLPIAVAAPHFTATSPKVSQPITSASWVLLANFSGWPVLSLFGTRTASL
jgi:deoxycytidine triphosphate deaminase